MVRVYLWASKGVSVGEFTLLREMKFHCLTTMYFIARFFALHGIYALIISAIKPPNSVQLNICMY